MTQERMLEVSERILKAMNDAQQVDGCTLDEVLMTTMYVCGSALCVRGVVLDFDAPLKEVMAPLVAGYIAETRKRNN